MEFKFSFNCAQRVIAAEHFCWPVSADYEQACRLTAPR